MAAEVQHLVLEGIEQADGLICCRHCWVYTSGLRSRTGHIVPVFECPEWPFRTSVEMPADGYGIARDGNFTIPIVRSS